MRVSAIVAGTFTRIYQSHVHCTKIEPINISQVVIRFQNQLDLISKQSAVALFSLIANSRVTPVVRQLYKYNCSIYVTHTYLYNLVEALQVATLNPLNNEKTMAYRL